MIKRLRQAWQEKKVQMLWAYLDSQDDFDPSAPINKLMTAILEQAIEKKAEAVRLVTKINRGALQGPPSMNDIENVLQTARYMRQEMTMEQAVTKSFHYRDFDKQTNDLIVDFRYAGTWHEEMSIPRTLIKPLLRHLKFRFNVDNFASQERPANRAEQAESSFSLESYAPEDNILAEFQVDTKAESAC